MFNDLRRRLGKGGWGGGGPRRNGDQVHERKPVTVRFGRGSVTPAEYARCGNSLLEKMSSCCRLARSEITLVYVRVYVFQLSEP